MLLLLAKKKIVRALSLPVLHGEPPDDAFLDASLCLEPTTNHGTQTSKGKLELVGGLVVTNTVLGLTRTLIAGYVG